MSGKKNVARYISKKVFLRGCEYMRCARNLTDACQKGDFDNLFELTKQIYGMCDAHGVENPKNLFLSYKSLVERLLQRNRKDDVIGMMDALAWEPSQKELARLLNVKSDVWSSILTTRVPRCC